MFGELSGMYNNHYANESQFDDSTAYRIRAVIDKPCFQPESRLIIRYDGEIMLCCEDLPGAFGLGNVMDKSIEDIWWSEKRAEIVATLRRNGGRRNYLYCRTCPRGYTKEDHTLKLKSKFKNNIKRITKLFSR